MIKVTVNKCFKPLAAAFSSYKFKNTEPFKMGATGSSSQQYMTQDAEKVFDKFFKENPPQESEKSFFDMTYKPKDETMEIDPYKVLGVERSASQQQIKQAYRKLALKYHPKKDSSMEASEKFIAISRAYDMINGESKISKPVSLAHKFEESVKEILNSEMGVSMKMNTADGKCTIITAELYNENKKVKKFGGIEQVLIEKEYNNNGKLLKFTRSEIHNEDGTVSVSESFDNGCETEISETLECTTKDDKGKKEQPKKQKKQEKKDNKQKKENKEKKPKA